MILLNIILLIFVKEALTGPGGQTLPPAKKCPLHEVLVPCGGSCEPSCLMAFPPSCTTTCTGYVCQCEPDYYRSLAGPCVGLDQCEHPITCDDVKCPCGRCTQDTSMYPPAPPKCSDGSEITCKMISCKAVYHCQQNGCSGNPIPPCYTTPYCAHN